MRAGKQMSILHIYFRHDTFVPRIRREMYGTVDHIATTGNLVTLCLGFSILSAIEILYFCTVRVFWNQMRKFYEANFATCNYEEKDSEPRKAPNPSPVIVVEPYTGSFRTKLQKVSLYDAPSSFYMINELYNPAHFLGDSHVKQ
ncbi:unnamed protein product [Allacma fusca]|uniref:Sodium channel protein Nach n=1 Tax=Allacma fusca TaxID=39272 RepID=A0A8J2K0V8_9HEXA|nr:unnamed protein product [Allacma fusca]